MLVAKGVVNTLAIDSHVLDQVLNGCPLVTSRPENLHGFMENFIPIELFLARHSFCLGYLYTSFWNEQSRIKSPKGISNVRGVTRLNLRSRLIRNFPAGFARYILEGRFLSPQSR